MRGAALGGFVFVGACFGDPPDVDTGETGAASTNIDAGTTSAGTTTTEGTQATTTATSDDTPIESTGLATGSSGSVQTADDGSGTTAGSEQLVLSLYEQLCSADIRSYQSPGCMKMSCQTTIPCDGPFKSIAGRAIRLDPGETEGNGEAMRVIELATFQLPDAFVTARFDSVSLEGLGAPRLRTTVWCGPAEPCLAWWQIEVSDGVSDVAVEEGTQIIDGDGAEVDLDLGPAAGSVVQIYLRMSNHGNAETGDTIRFADARVVDIGG